MAMTLTLTFNAIVGEEVVQQTAAGAVADVGSVDVHLVIQPALVVKRVAVIAPTLPALQEAWHSSAYI